MVHSLRSEEDLAGFISGFYADPYGFVMSVFPWGEPELADDGANPLYNKEGPEPWQKDLLVALGHHIDENRVRISMGLESKVWRSAIASGHGVGKSALVAWLILFCMSTRMDTRGVVTASTQFQLNDKTWPELRKWHHLAINSHWFEWTAEKFYFAQYPENRRKNYMTTAATVSEHKTEAFAGLHNEAGTVFIIFDEASGVLPKVWEITDGAFSDGEGFFFAFGNPTRPEGEFADCFDRHSDLYHTGYVDMRDVSFTKKSNAAHIIKKYGADSDTARVRVYGQFPSQSVDGFISVDVVRGAMERLLTSDVGAPLIMSVDVARFGGDETVIGFRQGRDYRTMSPIILHQLDNVKVAEVVMQQANRVQPDAIVIEGTGTSTGVIDIMRSRGYRISEVHPGAAPENRELFVNKRMEWWAKMRDWLYEVGCLPENDMELFRQLTTIRYTLDRHEQRMKMEAKKDIKQRGLPSPDRADALALTFAVRAPRRDSHLSRRFSSDGAMAKMQEDPLAMPLMDAV